MLLLLLSCSAQRGPGYMVTENDAKELVLAAPTYKERMEAAWLSTGPATISQDGMDLLRKLGGKVIVDTPNQLSGLDADTPVINLGQQADLVDILSKTDEKAAIAAMKQTGARILILHRDLRGSMDRDSKVLSRLYNHDWLEGCQLIRIEDNAMIYLLESQGTFPPNLAEAAIHWIRDTLSGKKPLPFAALKPDQASRWVLMVTMRGQGQELAVSLADGKTLDQALDEAARDLEMVHRRYRETLGFNILSKAVENYSFEIHRLVEVTQVLPRDEKVLESLWELGVDGAIIEQVKEDDQGRQMVIKEGGLPGMVAALRGITTADEFLRAVAKESRFDSIRPWRDTINRLSMVRTISYREVPAKGTTPSSVAPLYRGTLPMPMNLVTQQTVRDAVVMAGEWYLANLQEDGSVIYKFWPEENRFSSEYNHVRHELATWNLYQAWTLDPRPEFLEGARRAQDWTLKSLVRREPSACAAGDSKACFADWELEDLKKADPALRAEIEKEGMAYYTYGDNTKLGSVVVGLFGMIEVARAQNDHQYDDLMRDFGRFVRFMQTPDGSFRGYHVPTDHASRNATNDIVPGEAALSLVYLYEYFNDPIYLSTLGSFFEHYKPWFRTRAAQRHPDQPWPAYTYDNNTRLELVQFGPWSVMAANAYHRVRPDAKDVAEFGLEIARWMIENYEFVGDKTPFPDYVGGYYKFEGELPAMQAFCYAEGTAAAYDMALRAAPDQAPYFEKHTRESVRFGMQMQHDAFDTFAYARPYQVFGGIRYAMNEPKVRIDYTYHAQSSFYQWLMASKKDPNAPAEVTRELNEAERHVMQLMGSPSFRDMPINLGSGDLPAEATEKHPEDDGD